MLQLQTTRSYSWQTHAPPWGRPSNALSPVGANMNSDSLSTTTSAAIDIESPDRVKWRETLPIQKRICRKKYPRLWDNLLRSCSCPVICLCSPTGVSADSPVPSGVHALNWTAVEWISWEPPLKKKFVLVLVNLRRDWTRKGRISDVMRKVCWFKRSGEGGGCVNSSGTNQICCQCHLFCLFPVKVCPWYKTQKKNHKKTGKPAGAWYVHKLSVPGIQFRAAPVSLMAFSWHRTMMYTLEVGFTIFSNLMQPCECRNPN